MERTSSKFVRAIILSSLLINSGCGTLLYPEQRGSLSEKNSDLVPIHNGFGLLLYYIPGSVSFVVDVGNSVIFVPKIESSSLKGTGVLDQFDAYEMVSLPEGKLSFDGINETVEKYTGINEVLMHGELQISIVALSPGNAANLGLLFSGG